MQETQEIRILRQKKQQYLRQNIPQSLYEDFGEFCEAQLGQVNIDAWTFPYIQNLVNKFLQFKSNPQPITQSTIFEKTFHDYQTSNPNDIKQLAQTIQQNQKPINPTNHSKNSQKKPQKNNQKKTQKSATQLLDFVFQNINDKKFQTTNNSNHFDTFANDFWAIGTTNNNKSNHKQNNSKNINMIQTSVDGFFGGFNNDNIKRQSNIPTNSSFIKSKQSSVIHPTSESKKQYNFSKNKQIENKSLNKEQPTLNLKKSSIKLNKIQYEGPRVIKSPFETVVECFKANIRPTLNVKNLSVMIQSHQIIHRKFLAPDYVMYNLKVIPNNIECKRNFEDFEKLRKCLSEVYPGVHMPYLQKYGFLSQTNPDTVKKLKLSLQLFLNDILMNPELRNSRILQDFLTLKQHKRIKRKFQDYQRMTKVRSIEQLCLLEGKANIKIKEEQRIYHQKTNIYLNKFQDYFQKHKKLSETLSYQYEEILNTFISLSDLMKQIKKSVQQFNKRVTCNQIRNLSQTYQMLNQFYQQQTKNISFELELLNQSIYPFLKFEKQNIGTLRQIDSIRSNLLKQYIKRSENQVQNINSIPYDSQKCFNYKNGIITQSKNIVVLKYQAGFMSNQYCQESQRIFELLSCKISHRWKQIGAKYIQNYQKNTAFFKKIQSFEIQPSGK